MLRCLELAGKGKGLVKTNPLVGAVLVHENRIIGEGWHAYFGGPHAEVACINSVLERDRKWIPEATLYVSLEPCNHFGKTPPCTALILQQNIKKIVVGCEDPNPTVSGKGIAFLRDNGVMVITGVLEKQCRQINAVFFKNQEQQLPYIVLKYAQSTDGFIAAENGKRVYISNVLTNRFTHQLRATNDAIMVGSGTVLADNPQLNNRYSGTVQPIRIIADRFLKISKSYRVMDGTQPTIILNGELEKKMENLQHIRIPVDADFLKNSFITLYQSGIASILVEGGAAILQHLLQHDLWDKLIVITNETLILKKGIAAPLFLPHQKPQIRHISNNKIEIYEK